VHSRPTGTRRHIQVMDEASSRTWPRALVPRTRSSLTRSSASARASTTFSRLSDASDHADRHRLSRAALVFELTCAEALGVTASPSPPRLAAVSGSRHEVDTGAAGEPTSPGACPVASRMLASAEAGGDRRSARRAAALHAEQLSGERAPM
jgi:hypothetical protein